MVIKIQPEKEYKDKLIAQDMLKSEYVIIEKLYDKPMTGEAMGADGKFEWRLYTVAVHEMKSFNDETEKVEVKKFDTPIEVNFFKAAKTFAEKFDELQVNTIVKVTQTKPEGKAYKMYELEELGEGESKPTEPDKVDKKPPLERIKELKQAGETLSTIKRVIVSEYEGQTDSTVEAIYNAI